MDFIEKEKLRIEDEQKKKDAEKKAKADLAKTKELELQNKRDSIYKKVGQFMEQLLQKTIDKQRKAEAENLPDPINDFFYGVKFKGWEWEINWLNTTPRLWGQFNTGYDDKDFRFDSVGKSGTLDHWTETLSNGGHKSESYSRSVYIKCLVDIDKMALNITAKAEKEKHIAYNNEDTETYNNWNDYKSLQASYLGNKGLIIPIKNDDSFIDRIADLLIEIRYTWKFDVDKQVWKNIRYKSINKSLKHLETSLQSFDKFMHKIEKKNPEEFAKRIGYWVAGSAWFLLVIYLSIISNIGAGIMAGIILGIFGCGIVFFIIYCLSKILAFFLGYMSYQEYLDYEKKHSLEISNKKEDISNLINNLRATIDNDNIDKFVGDGFFLEFPLSNEMAESEHYTKKDFTSKIDSMIKRSKYEKNSN